MRLVLLSLLLVSSTVHAADTWTDPFPGVRRLHRVTANQNINVLVVDLCAAGVSVRATATNERQRTVGSFGALVGAQVAINGDFFSFQTYSTGGPAIPFGPIRSPIFSGLICIVTMRGAYGDRSARGASSAFFISPRM
jgi:hypothetical protein